MVVTEIYDSLTMIFPATGAAGEERRAFSCLRNEPLSFQMAYRWEADPNEEKPVEEQHFFLRVKSEVPVSIYHVGCVPVMHAYSRINPPLPVGMYPDILMKKTTNPTLLRQDIKNQPGFRYVEEGERISLAAYNDSWRQLWITVNEEGEELAAGSYPVVLELFNPSYEKVGEATVTVELLPASLPPQKLIYTNWYHNDCMADYYRVPLFSEEYYDQMRRFLEPGVRCGMNMILLPAFTPPLDTPIGEERMTVQLVKVKRDGGVYSFDFSEMERYISVCREAGILYFEHSHFFTQWGAAHAPKIMAEVDGKEIRLFGWDTDAAGEEYVAFLHAYIPAVRQFLRGLGLEKTTLFHISDEPSEKNYLSYERSLKPIRHLLEGLMVGDALSDPKFYESGLVQTPIARTHRAGEFVGKTDNLWCYYTGAECFDGLSNRLIQLPRERNRALGLQMYAFDVKGFLHWGYNFYYGRLSHGLYNPALDPCCGFPNAGTTYSVYPGDDGNPMPALRQKIFYEGICDMRALECLEALAGRKVCLDLIEKYLGKPDFYNTPSSPAALMAFRDAVNDTIRQYA